MDIGIIKMFSRWILGIFKATATVFDYSKFACTNMTVYECFTALHHAIIRAAFVSLLSPTPPRSFDGSSPNLVGVCRVDFGIALEGFFFEKVNGSMAQRVNGSNVTFFEQTTPG